MTAFEAFLDDLDRAWTDRLPTRLPFRVLGSTALFLQTTYGRRTRDGDVLRTLADGFDEDVRAELERIAGPTSALHRAHGLYLDLVGDEVPLLPRPPLWHAFPPPRAHIVVLVLDVVDVCISKLKTWRASDRADIAEMVRRGALRHHDLVDRFRTVIVDLAFDARAYDLPACRDRLAEVELDLFARTEPTPIVLPAWLDDG